MKNRLIFFLLAISLAVFSCSKDDEPKQIAPSISGFSPESGPVGMAFVISGSDFAPTIPGNTVTLNGVNVTVKKAEVDKLEVSVPAGASTGKIIVVTDGGTATSSNNFVVTTEETETTLTLNKSNLTLYPYPHYTETLTATTNVENPSLTWESSNTEIATVDQEGKIIPLKTGTATISVSLNGIVAECDLTIVDGPVTSLEFTEEELDLFREETINLEYTLSADVESTSAPVWSSSDESVATVTENGELTGVSLGTAEITITIDNAEATLNVTVKPDVYIGGFGNMGSITSEVGVIWKNGEPTQLTDNIRSRVHDLYVNESSVIAVGYQVINNRFVATMWVNGIAQALIDPSFDSVATSVYEYQNEIYVLGYSDEDNDNKDRIFVWTEGGLNYVTDDTTNSQAFDILVNEEGIALAGFYYDVDKNNNIAALWIDGTRNDLSDGSNSAKARAIKLSQDNTMYVAGYEEFEGNDNSAKRWNVSQQTEDFLVNGTESYAYAMDIDSNGTSYIVGSQVENGQYVGKLWVNTAEIAEFADDINNTFAESVALFNDELFVVGWSDRDDSDYALYWNSEVSQELDKDGLVNTRAAVVVVR